jgi:amino acid adenylation domain-containing protein
VKIRGYRIELGEIEAQLGRQAAVKEAVVVAREEAPGVKRLVGYVTVHAGHTVEAEVLREHLKQHLPEYMVPGAYVVLERLPLTANGKLDRRSLPLPQQSAYVTREYEAPEGEIERHLAQVWQEILQVPRVGRADNFFELGGHSLLAVQVISRVRVQLGVECPLREVFAQRDLRSLARVIAVASVSTLPPLGPAARSSQPPPLSYAQQRLWFLDRFEGPSSVYNVPIALRLFGELKRGALQSALDYILARHEALRTVFADVDGQPVQLIEPEGISFSLEEADLSDEPDPEAPLRAAVEKEVTGHFNLEKGPLIRGQLLRLAPTEHVLVITMHHIVSDGWSIGVLLQELSAVYTAFCEGRGSPLRHLEVQYADYAIWQRSWIYGERMAKQAAYWRQELLGAPPILEIPTDHVRPPKQDHAGATYEFVLEPQLTQQLRRLSLQLGTTLFTALLAGLAALLSRLSGQEVVVIGVPNANRSRAEIEPLVGFFVNTQALRIDLSGIPTGAELLRRVHHSVLAAQDNSDITFEQVVELLKPVRSLAHSPIFQVLFTWDNTPQQRIALPGLRVEAVPSPRSAAKFDLAFAMKEAGDGISGRIEYATSLFEAQTVRRYVDLLRTLLRSLAQASEQRVDLLPVLEPLGLQEVLQLGMGRVIGSQRDEEIVESFQEQCERFPDATAVIFPGGQIGYRELNARANRLARHLRRRGVSVDERVAIYASRGVDLVVAVLAILKAGGVYVPLDPAYPGERLRDILGDCNPRLLLTQTAFHPRVADLARELALPVITLDADGEVWALEAPSNLTRTSSGLEQQHLAYITYTSGSTGTPKAVMVEQRGFASMLRWFAVEFAVTNESAVLLSTAHCFDLTQKNILLPLMQGARLVIAPEIFEPAELLRLIRATRIDFINITPGLFEILREADAAGVLADVRRVVFGGEAPRVESLSKMAGPRPDFVNSYGPAEWAIAAFQPLDRDLESYQGRVLPLGRPAPNVRVYVVDRNLQPVPAGVIGEICLGGLSVCRGYLNKPGLTAVRFVPDPFAGDPGGRLYKTGDLGCWRSDGLLEFHGRGDFQVKVRGIRVEPAEAEVELRRHPLVGDVAVVARPAASGGHQLVAYVTTGSAAAADAAALREYLSRRLPDYLIPAAFVSLETLPLTSNGKLDRSALPSPGLEEGRAPFVAPRTQMEERVGAVWAGLLGSPDVGVHDDFFAVGGHSLLAMQLVSRLGQAFGVQIRVRELFECRTVEELALRIEILTAAAQLTGRRVDREKDMERVVL